MVGGPLWLSRLPSYRSAMTLESIIQGFLSSRKWEAFQQPADGRGSPPEQSPVSPYHDAGLRRI